MPEESAESAPGIGMLTERPFSRPHFRERVAPTGAPGAELGAQARHRWSLDATRRILGGVAGGEVRTDEQFNDALDILTSDRLKNLISELSMLTDAYLATPEGQAVLPEYGRRSREIAGEEGFKRGTPDFRAAEGVSQATGRKLNRLRAAGVEPPVVTEPPEPAREGDLDRFHGILRDLERRVGGAGRAEGPEPPPTARPRGREEAEFFEGFRRLEAALESNTVTLEQFGRRVADLLGEERHTPQQERALYVRLMYNGDLYARFTIGMEPRWYKGLSPKEQDKEDIKLQLARAAFYKHTFSEQAEKHSENSDLAGLSREKMKELYDIKGVRPAMEWYIRAMTDPTDSRYHIKVKRRDDEEEISFWKIQTAAEWEKFRGAMRRSVLGDGDVDDINKKEVDATAWNFLYVTNVVESLDSRYSVSGDRDDLPGTLGSDDLRAVFHPQEKYESKIDTDQDPWGVFGTWGVTQLNRIKGEVRYKEGDKIEFRGAVSPADFWTVVGERPNPERPNPERPRGRIITVRVPECHLPTTTVSFLEEVRVKGRTLLDYLQMGDKVPWDDMEGSDQWGASYLPLRLGKAVRLIDFYKGDDKLRIDLKPGWAVGWARTFKDINERLSFGRLPGVQSVKRTRLSPEQFHNLKVWLVYTSLGGVRDPRSRLPTINVSATEGLTDRILGWLGADKTVVGDILSETRGRVRATLAHPRVRYLEPDEQLDIIPT